ncbi:hypothetical protein FACS1894202_04100 [Clostridia bacterium]|nr:hypothetical protein FACS1894202_04100 [Clostridia bacterium]
MFQDLSLNHRELYQRYTRHMRTTEGSFASMFAWRHSNRLRIFESGGILYRHSVLGYPCYLYPLGATEETLPRALETLRGIEEGRLIFRLLSPEQKDLLEAAGGFDIEEDRDQADYLYAAEDLRELAGRSYHGKRNFIARFERERPGWSYEEVGDGNIVEVMAFQDAWVTLNGGPPSGLAAEKTAIAEMLMNWDLLGMMGGAIRAEGNIVAYTLGALVGDDTLDVHIEKANYEITGAYPMINREFARRHAVGDIKFINREEDMGIEGLRRAKLSYNPIELMMKYTARERV